jgi:hypothetical protein
MGLCGWKIGQAVARSRQVSPESLNVPQSFSIPEPIVQTEVANWGGGCQRPTAERPESLSLLSCAVPLPGPVLSGGHQHVMPECSSFILNLLYCCNRIPQPR